MASYPIDLLYVSLELSAGLIGGAQCILVYSGSVSAQASVSQEAFADHTAHRTDLLYAFMASQASSAALITAIILHLFV